MIRKDELSPARIESGFLTRNLKWVFSMDSDEYQNIKIFFDSYYDSFVDETFLSLFLEKPSNLVLYLSFNGYMLDTIVDTKHWKNEAPNDPDTRIDPRGQYE